MVSQPPRIFQGLISTLQLVERLDRYPLRNIRKIDSVESDEASMNVKTEAGTQVSNYVVQHLPRNPSIFSGEDGEDLQKWLKGYARVARYNHWDETLCLTKVYFYLSGTALKWFENNEESIQTWKEFTSQLENVFGKKENSKLQAEKKLKTRAQLKGESTEFYIQDVLCLCKEADLQMSEEDKISNLMKGIAEELYQALLPRDVQSTEQFITECRRVEALRCRRVTPTRYERLPNVASLCDQDDGEDLSSMIRQIVREEVQRALGSPREEPKNATIEEIVKEEIGRTLAPISKSRRSPPQKEKPRQFLNTRYEAETIRPHPEPRYPKQGGRRDTNDWRTTEGRPICFYCGRPGHVVRYCRDRKRHNEERRNDYFQRKQDAMFIENCFNKCSLDKPLLRMVETRSGKMQDPAQERIMPEESAKPQPGATIGRDASSDPVVLNPNIDIPKFDGTEDPRPWIESLEEIGFLYHWADYIISRYAAMNMIGSAKTWLNLHKISFTSWENFKSRLIQDFASDANKEEMKMRLNRMQQWNEPAIRFAEDILVLFNKVDPQMEEETKINWVIGGLKKEYSFALHLNPPKNTNELLEICKKLDLFEKNYQERAEKSKALYNGPRSPRPHHQEQWKNATSFRRPYQNTSKPQAPAPRYYQNTSKPQAPTPRYYQNKPLPQVSAPRRSYTPNPEPKPVYPSKTYNKNPNSNRNRTEDGRPICFKCNKPGHVARYCRVRIGICEALIDTGADLSVVDLNTALNTGLEIINPDKMCSGPDGKELDIVGNIILNIKFDDKTITHQFVIMRTHLRIFILGRDFLKKMNAKIDCQREIIKYDLTENRDVIKYQQKKIKSAKDAIIPELSIKLIKAFVEAEDGEYIIEENHKMSQTNGLRLARSLINVVNKETYIWITNPYPRPLKILKNQTLCFGSQPAEVNLVEESEQKEHEEPQFQINENLAYKEKEQLKQVLERYEDLFSSGLGRSNLAKHRIDTEGAKPIKHKPYRVSAKEREIIKEQIDEMLRDGIIRPSSSPWSFPVILVKKRDGKYRFCVDYRKLNDVTVKDVYPIPRIDDVMDTLQGSKYFSAIDLRSGYWQVEIEEKDKEKTAFTTTHGLYEFNVMPFGLCNAPATFERNMDNVLGNLRWQICLCYLDDVIIYSSDFPTHLKRLEAVLKCFSESNLKLNDKKCRFAFEELEILGHITNQQGIKPAEYNIKAVRDFPQPKKVKEVQSFLGMCSYYRKFIKDFSLIADPLTGLIRKNAQFTWTEKQEEAFQNLKKALINPPILGHFDPNAATYIHTDASNIGLGATLVQIICGEEKVISYLSRTLSKAEQNYSTTEKECLAVVWAISKLRPYLYGRHFKIITDHHALCWLKNLKDPTGRLARWALKIQEYDFDIIHKSGKKHMDADGLSRGPLPEMDWVEDYERLFLNQIINEEDEFIENVKKSLKGSKRAITQNFKEENGCLYKKNPNPEGRAWLLVVPKKRRKEIMSEFHNHMLNGHLGVARTTYRLKNKYHWPSMLKDVSEFVKTCHLCQSRKGSNQSPSGLLQPIPPANYPFERIGIDFVGPLPSTKRRRKWIIVLTDYYTKYAETKAVSEATVKEVSTFLIEQIFLHHGAPRFLISDRGSQFTSNLMKEVMKMCKVKHCFTTSYHPQTNGLTERLNRTLINMISMYVNTDQKNWDEILPFVTHAYNTTIQETTGYSPFFLLFGREPMSLLDDDNIPIDSNMNNYDEYIENYLDKIARTRQVVINNTEKTQERMKRNYDKKHNERIYEPGHLVAVWTPVRKIGKCEKLLRKYFGPYRILKKLSNVNYLIEPKDNPGQDPLIVHVSRLKPYFERIDEVTHEDVGYVTVMDSGVVGIKRVASGCDMLIDEGTWVVVINVADNDLPFGIFSLNSLKISRLTIDFFSKRIYQDNTMLAQSQYCFKDYFTPSLKNFTIQPDPNNHTMPNTTQSFLHDNLNSTTNVENYIAAHPHLINDCKKLIRENIGLFPIDKFSVPALNIDQVKIIPNSDKIITLRPYRIPYSDYPEIKYQIEKMLENEIIEPSNSPYAAPVTLARKRDGSKRFCVDFRKLNELMSVDNYPIPLIETVLDQLSNSKYFSTIDITSAFWQIPIHPESRPLLSFVTHLGQYHFNRLPFGLKLSPQIFERQLNQLIQKHKLTFTNHYFDDFIIHSNSLEEHLGHLQEFLNFCKLENIKLNLNKCQFFRTSIDYLGYKISSGTCTPLVRNIDVINAIKPPTNVKTLQSFLGAINVYNKFIPDYARIRNSLNQLLKKNVKWEWTSDCQKAFDKLKQVYSDASLQGIGGVLKQLHLSLSPDGNSYPVQYYSRTLRKYERNYTITELECLAIIETVDRFKVYLAGNCFTIFTDHCALQWLKNIKNPTGRLFRWSLRLSVYDYQVKYIKGTKQLEADLLSRNPFCGLLDATQLKMYQSELRDNSKYVHQTSGLTTVTRRGVSKTVVPPSLRPTILREAHHKFNHPGISQLTRIISAQYFWSGMSIDIRAFVKNCNICQMSKTPKGPKYGELGELPESPLPFDLVSMDTIAGFSRYGSAKNYLHVVVDHATRFAWTFPSRSTSTTTYIQVIKKVLQSGCPKRLLTDRAPAFTSPRFRRFLISHNIQPMLTTSNHPQANGLSERLNATLTGKLRLLHLQHPRASWTMLQSKVVKAYNDTPHSVTGFPPTYLMDGSLPKELSQHLDPYPSVTESRRLALQRTKERHKIDKIRFDKNHRSPDFEVGDLVLTKIYQHPNTGKLVPYFSGPYEIIEVISPYTVRINRPNQAQNLETEIIHVNKLKHYSEDTKYIFTPHSMNNNSAPKSYFIYHHFPPEIFHDDYKNYASTLSNPFNHMNPDIFLDNDEQTLTARYISTPDTIPKIAIRLKPSPTTKIILPSSPTRNHTPQISPQLRAPLINCDNTKLEN
ncbi:hypothetical protein LAZ67_16002112, partial [Cordylochernes scorpioides]